MLVSNPFFQPRLSKIRPLHFSLVVLLGLITLSSLSLGPNPIFEDDAFFYWVSAIRTVEHGFPTFDGYEPTNGFHWAWFLVLASFAFISESIGVSTATTKAVFLILPSLIVWMSILLSVNKYLLFLTFTSAFFVGATMESSLAGLFLGIGLVNLAQRKSSALWFTLAMILRVDLIIAVSPALLILPRRQVIHVVGGMMLAVVSSLAVNYLLVGEFFTVSSEIKASNALKSLDAYVDNTIQNISSYGNLYRYFVVLVLNLFAVLIYARNFKKLHLSNFLTIIFIANSFLIFHSVASSMRDWYFAPTIISLLLINSFYIAHLNLNVHSRVVSILHFAALTGLVLMAIYCVKYYQSWLSGIDFHRDTCVSINNERIFVYDGSGKLAWNLYACGTVTNGDGLVNSHAYLRNVKEDSLYLNYLQDNQIRFYITNNQSSRYNCPAPDSCFEPDDVVPRLRSWGGSELTTYTLVEILHP